MATLEKGKRWDCCVDVRVCQHDGGDNSEIKSVHFHINARGNSSMEAVLMISHMFSVKNG